MCRACVAIILCVYKDINYMSRNDNTIYVSKTEHNHIWLSTVIKGYKYSRYYSRQKLWISEVNILCSEMQYASTHLSHLAEIREDRMG